MCIDFAGYPDVIRSRTRLSQYNSTVCWDLAGSLASGDKIHGSTICVKILAVTFSRDFAAASLAFVSSLFSSTSLSVVLFCVPLESFVVRRVLRFYSHSHWIHVILLYHHSQDKYVLVRPLGVVFAFGTQTRFMAFNAVENARTELQFCRCAGASMHLGRV